MRRIRRLLTHLAIAVAVVLPTGENVMTYVRLASASIQNIVPTEDVLQASNSVVGIDSPTGRGSATYIGNGYFVSAHHVVAGSEHRQVLIRDWHLGLEYNGVVAIWDEDSDVVIIHTQDLVLTPPARLAWSDPAVGDMVHGVGFGVSYQDNKEGCERRLWSGIVTKYTENIGGFAPNAIQSTNPAIPGDSGGALFNDKGELIGVIHATDYIHSYSIRNACVHKLLRKLENNVKQEEKKTGGEDS